MTTIQLPVRLHNLLGSGYLAGSVYRALEPLDTWISDNTKGLAFFPEFTDHGPRHITKVLQASEALIPDPAWDRLTPEDAAILVLACVLHDSAMHITEDGFLALINSRRNHELLSGLNDKLWPDIWEDFFAEARRWDSKTISDIIGGPDKSQQERQDLSLYLRRPEDMGDPDHWPRAYRKFIGEFIRRYHARLAHEFAVFGIPATVTSAPLKLGEIDPRLADLAGLVARSHNLAIRDTFDYLENEYSGRVICNNSHPVFLMAVLRIADFLDIKRDRAPKGMLGITHLRSPVSRGEWAAHDAVIEVRPDERDREAIFILAHPADVHTFLRLKKSLTDLQSELDISWAVLGEVYSKQGDLNLDKLGLSLRRVRSNLDNLEKFSEGVDYLPVHCAFQADAELLKLLVRPLYGDNPEFGIRELVQNAVDAVRELREFCRQCSLEDTYNRLPSVSSLEVADVSVSVQSRSTSTPKFPYGPPAHWQHWVEVADRGIGMHAMIVQNYFLKAGASFRSSDAWRRQFTDSSGKSMVFRSGRFGIGLLAAFLLGEEIAVSTRHISSSVGLYFTATVDQSAVELKHLPGREIGTTVRVRLSEELRDKLIKNRASWDWYSALEPRVIRMAPDGQIFRANYRTPSPHAELPENWRGFAHSKYAKVFWTFEEKRAPGLACNGILVEKVYRESRRFKTTDALGGTLRVPRLAIYDPDGLLPINLQRTGLQREEFESDGELLRDILRDYFGFLIATAPEQRVGAAQFRDIQYPGLSRGGLGGCVSPWILTEEGAVFAHRHLLAKSGLRRVFLLPQKGYESAMLPQKLDSSRGLSYYSEVINVLLPNALHGGFMTRGSLSSFPISGVRIAVRRSLLKTTISPGSMDAEEKVRVNDHNRGWVIYEQGAVMDLEPELVSWIGPPGDLADRGGYQDAAQFYIVCYFSSPSKSESSLAFKFWKECGLPVILPFDSVERAKILRPAFNSIGSYIETWKHKLRERLWALAAQ